MSSAMVAHAAGRLGPLLRRADDVELDDAIGRGLTVRDWITAGVTVVAFVVVGRLARIVVERVVRRTDSEGQIARFVGRVVQNGLAIIGLIYALNALEVRIGPLLGALGITGIAIAFALTAILENVFASVMLKTRRPIRVGDQITTNEHSGTVKEINFRTVVLRNFDGETVVVPSSMVINEPIVNHTRRRLRRTVLVVGVGYRTDLRRAQEVILEAVADVEDVRDNPPPEAWVTTFNESSIDFEVRYWHAPDIATVYRVRSGVAMAVKTALDDAGIEIPFPQRVITVVEDESATTGRDA
jgi:small conductance mechanosensitive channel